MDRARVTLKIASTLDGKIATAAGESQWITGEIARGHVHLLRAQHQGIAVGSGTALADNPRLNVRMQDWQGTPPIRILFDGRLQTPANCRLFDDFDSARRILFTHRDTSLAQRSPYKARGVEIFGLDWDDNGFLDLSVALRMLLSLDVDNILVEGGGRLAASFIHEGLVDRIEWFAAPTLLGSDAIPAMGPLAIQSLADLPRFSLESSEICGEDIWLRLRSIANSNEGV